MEDSRKQPRRLLSFDSSQNPWTRFGKVFAQRSSGRSPAEEQFDTWRNYTGEYAASGPILAMTAASDKKLAAVLGANYLDIVEMYAEPHQLGSIPLDPKTLPLTIEWGQQNTKAQIAMASTTGKLQLFSSLGQVITSSGNDARSPVCSLSFSSMAAGNVLAGAASDGSVRIWDLRQGLRRAVSTFHRRGDIARQVQFRPDLETKFAVIYDSGMTQRWDVRKPSAPDTRIAAHIQGLTLNWHPTANYLATGGRDHLVHVWNFNTDSKSPEYTINTASPVGRVRWMPGDNSVSNNAIITSGRSAAGSNSRSVKYWLLKSPWVPIYSLETHTDSIVDLAVASPSLVWSASKDGKLVQHDLRFEQLVYDNFTPAVAEWSGAHSVAINTHEKLQITHVTPVQTPQPLEEEAGDMTPRPPIPSGTKTPTSLSFLGNSFTVQNSPASSASSSSAATPAGSYFTSVHNSSPMIPSSVSPGTRSEQMHNLSGAINRMLDERHLSPIVEMDFLPPNCGVLDSRVNQYMFEPLPNKSLSQTCLYNAQIETPVHTCNLWQMLAAAIDEIEGSFLSGVTGKTHEIAESWFRGEIQDDGGQEIEAPTLGSLPSEHEGGTSYDGRTSSFSGRYDWGIDDNTWQLSGASFTSEASEDDVSMAQSPRSPPARRRRPSGLNKAYSTKSIPMAIESTQFAQVKQEFLDYVASRSQPWGFISILRGLIEQSIEDGLVYTTTALVLLFKRFSEIIDLPNTDEVVVTCIEIMRSQQLFVTASHLMGITPVWQDHMGTPETGLDVVCQYCKCSLSENTAFFKNDSVTGYWYCGRCKSMQHGCSLCNIAVKGLGVVMECGHRSHDTCWKEWVHMGMVECPAGCGQKV